MTEWEDLELCMGMRRFIAEAEAVYAGLPDDASMTLQRRTYERLARKFTRQRPSGVRVRNFVVEGEAGHRLRARVYRPVDATPGATILYFHGGGFSLGSIESHDCVVAELALAASASAVSIEYRLAPEHPFPAAFNDATAAWRHLVENASTLGIDPANTIVAGDSSGAALAVAVCQHAKANRSAMPAGQLLIYPALTADADLPSYVDQADAPMLTAPQLARFWSYYTGAGLHAADPYAAPLKADDFHGLPPAFVTTAHYDPCRDDGAVYASRLRDADVDVVYRCAAKLAHGFIRARAMSPAAAAEFAAICEGARALLRATGETKSGLSRSAA